jgi:hypothetical protein
MPTFKPLVPKKLRPRADLNPSDFRKLLFQKGFDLKWEMAAECPCQRKLTTGSASSLTREPRIDCPRCAGLGVVYHSPQIIKAWVGGSRGDVDFQRVYGEYDPGMIHVTMLPEHTPGMLDRLTLMQSVLVFRETRQRSALALERLRYPVIPRTLTVGSVTDSTVSTTQTVDVLYLQKSDADGVVATPPATMPAFEAQTSSYLPKAAFTAVNVAGLNNKTLTFQDALGTIYSAKCDTSVAHTASTATVIGCSSVTINQLASAVSTSINQAISYGVASTTQNVTSGTLLRVTAATPSAASFRVQQVDSGVEGNTFPQGSLLTGELISGTDFTIAPNGQIDWQLGNAAGTSPTENQWYSVSYYTYPTYVVTSIPHAFRDTVRKTKSLTAQFANLPVQVQCKLEFLPERGADG